jgi:cell division protein FtsZ
MGIGRAEGENRAVEAAKAAINSPLLEVSINGAKGVLFNITGGSDLVMQEVSEAAKIVTESIDPNAKVIFGAVISDDIKKGEVKVTVIATGFESLRSSDQPELIHTNENEGGNSFLNEENRDQGFIKPKIDLNMNQVKSDSEEEFEVPAFIRNRLKRRNE